MSFLLRSIRRLLIVVVIAMIFVPSLFGQVTIREKIVIFNSPRQISQAAPAESLGSALFIPKKGNLRLWYVAGERKHSRFPQSTKLAITRLRGYVTSFDTVVRRMYVRDSINFSTCYPTSYWQYGYSGLGNLIVTDLSVQPGDTVRLLHITDFDPADGILDTLAIEHADTIQSGLWSIYYEVYDSCHTRVKEYLNLYVDIMDTTVTFSPISKTAYPKYFGHNNSTDRNDTLDLTLRVQFGDSLVKNAWVKVDTTVLVENGGHSHGGYRPLGTFLLPRVGGGFDSVRSFTRQTDSTGSIRFKYLASEFGGVERIRAVRLGDVASFDTLRISTLVPGLLPFTGAGNYVLAGASGAHSDNHYFVNQTAISALVGAANQFAVAGWNTTGLMRMNDMSLARGGGFDIAGGWGYDIAKIKRRPGHRGHREGKSVDIENLQLERVDTVSQVTGNDTSFTIPKVKWVKKFVRFMELDMGSWKFQDENQLVSDIYHRTRKYPHFDWAGN